MSKKFTTKKRPERLIAANLVVRAVGLGLIGKTLNDVEINTSPDLFDRTFVALKLVIGFSLFVIFIALAYGFGSWAIDSGKYLAYLLAVLSLIVAVRSLVVSIKSCKSPATNANG